MSYQSPWVPFQKAFDHVASAVGEAEAWPQIREAIRDGVLKARALCDGVNGPLHKEWLSIAIWSQPEGGMLRFEGDKHHRVIPTAPARAERIEVDSDLLRRLWPIPTSGTPGPKPKTPTPKDEFCMRAEEILASGQVKPGRGSVAAIAKTLVQDNVYAQSTAERYIRLTVRAWEKANEHKPDSTIRKSGK